MNEASVKEMLACSIVEDVGGFCWGKEEAEYEGGFLFFFFPPKNIREKFHPGEPLVVLESAEGRPEYILPVCVVRDDLEENQRYRFVFRWMFLTMLRYFRSL